MRVVALSGGKDSTALALRLKELEPDEPTTYLITPTGDELPPMLAHWERLEELLGQPMTRVEFPSGLNGLIGVYSALPNWRQRWCTRQLKIQPCLDWIKMQPTRVQLMVGLRADEEDRQGIYSSMVDTRFPLREWGWGLKEVVGYLEQQGIEVPKCTDCARCYGQRLYEWYDLWRDYPEIYEDAAQQEREIGHTFRSPQRDKWPAALDDLAKEFESGRKPPRRLKVAQGQEACRVCRT